MSWEQVHYVNYHSSRSFIINNQDICHEETQIAILSDEDQLEPSISNMIVEQIKGTCHVFDTAPLLL